LRPCLSFERRCPRLQRWPWPYAVCGDHTRPADDAGLEVESLADQPVATLWPYRPKREPDELFSSWLWRIARGLGVPPKRFAREVIGPHLTDIDSDVSDTVIERLAFLSGQTREHLLRGTMRPDVTADPADLRGRVQQRLLRHGDLVLNRPRRGRRGGVPVIQYCPVCLGQAAAPASAKGRGRPPGKRSDPDFKPTTLFLRTQTKRAAMRLLEDRGDEQDLSELVEQLLSQWNRQHS